MRCSVLQCVSVRCSVLQCVAVHCSALQCIAVHCSALQCIAVHCSALQCIAMHCSVLQCVAVCCNVLPCVAVCCSVLQCVAVHFTFLDWKSEATSAQALVFLLRCRQNFSKVRSKIIFSGNFSNKITFENLLPADLGTGGGLSAARASTRACRGEGGGGVAASPAGMNESCHA